MKKLVLAYSGGLDTSYCVKYLSKDCGYEVHAVLVNTGGYNSEDIETVKGKAFLLGAKSFICIEASAEFYDTVIKYLIYGNVLKNDTYPLSVSAERIVQAIAIVKYAKEQQAGYIAHGSTGAGNDQVRFDMIFQTLAPEIEIVTPIREQSLSRQDSISYLGQNGIDLTWEKAKYSINKGIWGTSVGGAETLSSNLALPSSAYPSQLEQIDPLEVKLSFLQGEIVAINDQHNDPVQNILQLNTLAAGFAIGRDIHVGDTIIGIKGRVGFEAGGPLIIIKAHHLLEKHTLSKWQLHWNKQLGDWYGMLLHEGHYYDPVMRNIECFLADSQKLVSGDVFVKLHPYRFELMGVASKNDLMQADFGNYGEEAKLWTSDEAKGFIKLMSNASKIYQHVNDQADV